jgi:transcription elongation factor GreA
MAWAQGRHIVIEQILNNSKIIEKNRSGDDIIEIGHIITVDANGKKKEYCIVGPQEADPFAGKISNESPLGQSFIGRKVGETVKVITPAGEQKFKILTIK